MQHVAHRASDSAGRIRDDRDGEIAQLIRSKIASEEAERVRLGYRLGSPEDAYIQGRIVWLRLALAFVDPEPHK